MLATSSLASLIGALAPSHAKRATTCAPSPPSPDRGTGQAAGLSVTLSSSARQALEAEQARNHRAQAIPAEATPLEKYAAPKWLADYGFLQPAQLGVRGDSFADRYPQAAAAPQAMLFEYSKRLNEHLRAALDAYGIHTLDDYHEALIVNQAKSEQIRQQLADSIRQDPRMLEIMSTIGKLAALG